jgi:trehalose 6-phosphate synthase/phosphatase
LEQKKGLRADWKKEILPILQAFAEKTPGSFVEEKSFSLVWHYRMSDAELGEIRAAELMNNLRYIINNYGLTLMPGNKIVEVKNVEINKGDVVLNYLQNNFYDFVFAVGDDLTDEDMFHALLNYEHLAITIKVNGSYSSARYCVKDYKEVRNILKQLSAKNMVSKWLDKFIESIPANFSRKK